MNSLPSINKSTPATIQLTIPQLTRIFEQLGISGATFASHAQAGIQLEPFQVQSLGCFSIAIPMPNLNAQSPTVQSIISSTIPTNQLNEMHQTRVDRDFIRRLADQLEISERELIDVIQNPASGNVSELTHYLNDIFGELITPPLTQEDIRQMLAITSF